MRRGADWTVYFFSFPWDAATKSAWSVPAMETFAAATFVHIFGDRCKGQTLLLESDSRDTVHAWGRRVPGQCEAMSWTLLAVDTACTVHDCDVRITWIAGLRNVVADAASRGLLQRMLSFADGTPVVRLFPSQVWLRTWLPALVYYVDHGPAEDTQRARATAMRQWIRVFLVLGRSYLIPMRSSRTSSCP